MIENIEINRQQLLDTMAVVNSVGKNAKPIQVRALNKTGTFAKSATAKAVNSEINLAQKVIKGSIGIRKASQASPQASILIAGKPIPLIDFKPTQTKKGVTFRIRKGSPRERYRHAFIATMRNGSTAGDDSKQHRGVFERNISHINYDGRLPIREKYGPSIPNVFEFTPNMSRDLLDQSSARLVKELDDQLQRVLRGF